ncbi:MAG: hypothetical protein V4613_10735 [Bacteroidota bacterium]
MIAKPAEYRIAETNALLKAATICWKSISALNGYWQAIESDFIAEEMRLLHLCEIKNSLEHDQLNIALIRLLEANASENALNEPLALLIRDMLSTSLGIRHSSSHLLLLNYNSLPVNRKEKEQINVQTLRKDINNYFETPADLDPLLQMALIYGYMVHPENSLKYKHLMANYFVNFKLFENGQIQQPALPLGFAFKSDNRTRNAIINEAYGTGNLQTWCLYFLQQTNRAAIHRLNQLKNMVQQKKVTLDLLSKHTAYPLPSKELNTLLASSVFMKAGDIISIMQCHRQTAYAYLQQMTTLGLITEKKSGREKLFFHKRLFDILADEQV